MLVIDSTALDASGRQIAGQNYHYGADDLKARLDLIHSNNLSTESGQLAVKNGFMKLLGANGSGLASSLSFSIAGIAYGINASNTFGEGNKYTGINVSISRAAVDEAGNSGMLVIDSTALDASGRQIAGQNYHYGADDLKARLDLIHSNNLSTESGQLAVKNGFMKLLGANGSGLASSLSFSIAGIAYGINASNTFGEGNKYTGINVSISRAAVDEAGNSGMLVIDSTALDASGRQIAGQNYHYGADDLKARLDLIHSNNLSTESGQLAVKNGFMKLLGANGSGLASSLSFSIAGIAYGINASNTFGEGNKYTGINVSISRAAVDEAGNSGMLVIDSTALDASGRQIAGQNITTAPMT